MVYIKVYTYNVRQTKQIFVMKTDQSVHDKIKALEAEELEVLQKIHIYREANRIEFFTKPNPLQAQLLEAWDNPVFRVFTFTGANRIGKCLTYQTLIETPDGKKMVSQLYEEQNPFRVYAWDGEKRVTAKASAPFKKEGLHKCYRITMSDGRFIEAADHHKILTSHGWISVEQLSKCFHNLQESSLDISPLTHPDSHAFCNDLSHDYSFLPPFYIIGDNDIKSIAPISTMQEVYDFEVKKYHNYFAGGVVHHNTTIGTIIAFSVLFGYWPWNKKKIHFPHNKPRKIRYIGQDWEKQISKVVIPEMEKWWPANRSVAKKKNNQGIEATWNDTLTGGTIEIMSNGQESDLHEGWSGDLIVYDEPPKRPIRVANARGLIDRNGRELFCMTLLKEAWVAREVIKAVDADGIPDKTIFNISGDIANNIGFGITQEGVDQYIKTLTEDEIEARIKGIPSYMSGLVYPAFDRRVHLCNRFKIPLDWIIDISIDIHPREKQAVLFCAVSPKGNKYLVNEIWEHGDGKWVAEEIVRCIKHCNYRVGSVIIDPLSKGDSNNENTVFDKIQMVLWSYGISLMTASKDKNSGILEIKNHLKGPNNEPSLFIFNDLVRTIFEIEGYTYDKETQKPIDKDDHMMENLYRLMLLNTIWSPVEFEFEKHDQTQIYHGRSLVGGY